MEEREGTAALAEPRRRPRLSNSEGPVQANARYGVSLYQGDFKSSQVNGVSDRRPHFEPDFGKKAHMDTSCPRVWARALVETLALLVVRNAQRVLATQIDLRDFIPGFSLKYSLYLTACNVEPSMPRKIVTVDISNFEERKHEIASQLLEASKDVGFFYIGGACSYFNGFANGRWRLSRSVGVKPAAYSKPSRQI